MLLRDQYESTLYSTVMLDDVYAAFFNKSAVVIEHRGRLLTYAGHVMGVRRSDNLLHRVEVVASCLSRMLQHLEYFTEREASEKWLL